MPPVRTANIKKIDHIKDKKDAKEMKLLYTRGGNVNEYDYFCKKFQFIKKLNIHLPYNPGITLLGFTQEK